MTAWSTHIPLALIDKSHLRSHSMAPVATKLSQTTTFRVTQTKTPAHTLIRVRNNQRRHRERRREYITSLEQKLEETEGLLAQAKAKIAALKAELESWKCRIDRTEEHFDSSTLMLDIAGYPPVLSLGERQSTEAEKQQGPRVDEVLERSTLAPYSVTASATALVTTAVGQDLSVPTPPNTHFSVTDSSTPLTVPSPKLSSFPLTVRPERVLDYVPSACPPPCCSLVDEPSTTAFAASSAPGSQDLTFLPAACSTYSPSDGESTTLCSQAYVLITQQNFRGLNAHTIRSWLDQGFRRAKGQGEGCRVENSLLFGLLDFISGT